MWPQGPLQPHWPQQPLQPHFLKKLPDLDDLIINGIKMTNNGHFLWNGWSKIQIFTYLWHLLCYFFENWMMKVKYPNLKIIQIPSNTILQAYFYLSGPNYFWRLNIRYPVTEVIISKIMEQASNKCRSNDHGYGYQRVPRLIH